MWDNPRGSVVIQASISSLVLAAIAVSLRLYTRARILHAVWIDDWFLLLALLCSVGETAAMWQEVKYGLGKPMADVTLENIGLFVKFLWISSIFYNFSLTFTKLSLLLGYLRVFPHHRVILASKIAIGFILSTGCYWLVSICLLCRPTAFFWDKTLKGGSCIDSKPIWLSHAGLNMVTDLLIILIPMPVLSSLHLARKAKFSLIAVFALGIFVIVASIVRIPMLLEIFSSPDVTYSGPGAAALSAIESNVAIFCASLPPLRSFVKQYAPPLMTTMKGFSISQSDTLPAASESAIESLGRRITVANTEPNQRES